MLSPYLVREKLFFCIGSVKRSCFWSFTERRKMEKKTLITLDGRMEDPAWENAKIYTDFRKLKKNGGELVDEQTIVQALSYINTASNAQ